jgi:shikimate kinase
VVCDHCAAELGDITLEVNEVFRLLSRMHIIEVYVLVSPLKVMNDSFIREFFLEDENVLKEF